MTITIISFDFWKKLVNAPSYSIWILRKSNSAEENTNNIFSCKSVQIIRNRRFRITVSNLKMRNGKSGFR